MDNQKDWTPPVVRVESFDGLYDETGENRHVEINRRPILRCRSHSFINGSVGWTSRKAHIDGGHDYTNFYYMQTCEPVPAAARVCTQCAFIDCLHLYDDLTIYAVYKSRYNSHRKIVGRCRFCEKRIIGGNTDFWECDPKVRELIDNLLATGDYLRPFWPYYVFDFPAKASEILNDQGEEMAIRFIKEGLIRGRQSLNESRAQAGLAPL